jgi:hypothetical protein
MPHPPKTLEIIVVKNTATHIIDYFYTKELGKSSMDPPNN